MARSQKRKTKIYRLILGKKLTVNGLKSLRELKMRTFMTSANEGCYIYCLVGPELDVWELTDQRLDQSSWMIETMTGF
jgi:hypothetical protein